MIPVPMIVEVTSWWDGLVRIKLDMGPHPAEYQGMPWTFYRMIDNDPTRLEPVE